jgi:hypothetical protein
MEPRISTKKCAALVAGNSGLDLEFPDWSGMDDTSARITPEAAFRLLEFYPRFAAGARAASVRERPEKCAVEFVL